jgi:nucleoside-diphosphate-sugar epimerase
MFNPTTSRLPKGSTIFVTGVTGYIGSWVAYEALSLGYNVRGAVRSLEKATWLQDHFDSTFGPGRYSQVSLSDSSDLVGFAEGIKGVSGIAHVAVNTARSTDPEPYIPNMVKETVGILKAAQAESTVRSVVFTSTALAASAWGAKGKLIEWQYNEDFIGYAYDPNFQHPSKVFIVYGAAKAISEKAAWKYMQEEKPHFSFNTILPNVNFGPSLVYEKQGYGSSGRFPKAVFDNDESIFKSVLPMYHIDVRDDAKLHVAALVDPETAGRRLWGYGEPFHWNVVLGIFRKLWPQRKFLDDFPGLELDDSEPPTEGALKALKNVFGQDGWTSLETSLKDAGLDREPPAGSKKMDIFN